MEAKLEKIQTGVESSFSIKKFVEQAYCGTPTWHYHPEFEIVFISNGKGKRHIGHHISYYKDGDLIFLGPNLPHFGFTLEMENDHQEVVVQMQEDFLGKEFLKKPEFFAVRQLMERARTGLSFYGETRKTAGTVLKEMTNKPPFEKLLDLLRVLQILAESTEYEELKATGIGSLVKPIDQTRLNQVYGFVQKNYTGPISLEDIAGEVSMSIPAFCRYFKKITGTNFTRFVNEFRVAAAKRLLESSELSISEAAFTCGFNNLSHFNKQFKLIVGSSPRIYREKHASLVNLEAKVDPEEK